MRQQKKNYIYFKYKNECCQEKDGKESLLDKNENEIPKDCDNIELTLPNSDTSVSSVSSMPGYKGGVIRIFSDSSDPGRRVHHE